MVRLGRIVCVHIYDVCLMWIVFEKIGIALVAKRI